MQTCPPIAPQELTEQCPANFIQVCAEERCFCAAAFNSGAVFTPNKGCTVTVGYPEGRPDLPSLQFSAGDCAMNAEIALAVALASLLKLTMLAVPVPK